MGGLFGSYVSLVLCNSKFSLLGKGYRLVQYGFMSWSISQGCFGLWFWMHA